MLSPLPSWPRLLRPQHWTVPSERRIHVNIAPAEMVVALTLPLVVNCCVWPTAIVGPLGATVMAKAGAPVAPKVSPSTSKTATWIQTA